MSDTVWLRSDDWVGTTVDGSFVMVNVETGKYVTLNETAGAIWHSLDAPKTEGDIGAQLTEKFDVAPEECAAAVTNALATMRELALVSPESR